MGITKRIVASSTDSYWGNDTSMDTSRNDTSLQDRRGYDIDKYSIPVEELEELISEEEQKRYFPDFEFLASYMGNGIHSISGLYSSDTRQLFLMYCLMRSEEELYYFSRNMKRKFTTKK